MPSKLEAIRKLDAFGLLLLLGLAALAVGAGCAALYFGWFRSPWQLAVWLVVCVAFLVVGLPTTKAERNKGSLSQNGRRARTSNARALTKKPRAQGRETEAGKEGVYLGFFADDEGAMTLRYKGGKHLLSFGTPGANKSAGLVVPNLAHLPRSVHRD